MTITESSISIPPESNPLQEALHEEALSINSQVDEAMTHIEKSPQELADRLIKDRSRFELSTISGEKICFLPFADLRDRIQKSPSKNESIRPKVSTISSYYQKSFDEAFDAISNYKKFLAKKGDNGTEDALNYEEAKDGTYMSSNENLLSTNIRSLLDSFSEKAVSLGRSMMEKGLIDHPVSNEDLYKMEPEQLISVIVEVLGDSINYDAEILTDWETEHISDTLGYDKLLNQNSGVCRHISSMATLIYESIKRSDRLDPTLKGKYDRTFLLNYSDSLLQHAYNVAVYVEPSGDIYTSILDPTWGIGREDSNFNERFDYTTSRFLNIIDDRNHKQQSLFSSYSSLTSNIDSFSTKNLFHLDLDADSLNKALEDPLIDYLLRLEYYTSLLADVKSARNMALEDIKTALITFDSIPLDEPTSKKKLKGTTLLLYVLSDPNLDKDPQRKQAINDLADKYLTNVSTDPSIRYPEKFVNTFKLLYRSRFETTDEFHRYVSGLNERIVNLEDETSIKLVSATLKALNAYITPFDSKYVDSLTAHGIAPELIRLEFAENSKFVAKQIKELASQCRYALGRLSADSEVEKAWGHTSFLNMSKRDLLTFYLSDIRGFLYASQTEMTETIPLINKLNEEFQQIMQSLSRTALEMDKLTDKSGTSSFEEIMHTFDSVNIEVSNFGQAYEKYLQLPKRVSFIKQDPELLKFEKEVLAPIITLEPYFGDLPTPLSKETFIASVGGVMEKVYDRINKVFPDESDETLEMITRLFNVSLEDPFKTRHFNSVHLGHLIDQNTVYLRSIIEATGLTEKQYNSILYAYENILKHLGEIKYYINNNLPSEYRDLVFNSIIKT